MKRPSQLQSTKQLADWAQTHLLVRWYWYCKLTGVCSNAMFLHPGQHFLLANSLPKKSQSVDSKVWNPLVGHGVAPGKPSTTGQHHADRVRPDHPGILPHDGGQSTSSEGLCEESCNRWDLMKFNSNKRTLQDCSSWSEVLRFWKMVNSELQTTAAGCFLGAKACTKDVLLEGPTNAIYFKTLG